MSYIDNIPSKDSSSLPFSFINIIPRRFLFFIDANSFSATERGVDLDKNKNLFVSASKEKKPR